MDPFNAFIPDCDALDPAALQRADLAFAPLPELLGEEELLALAAALGPTEATLWSYGHKQEPQVFAGLEAAQLADLAFDEGHNNLLIGFHPQNAWLWQPMAHEFCVLAAPLPVLRPLLAGDLFPYRFADYCAEPSFSPRKQAALAAIGQKYDGLALSARG